MANMACFPGPAQFSLLCFWRTVLYYAHPPEPPGIREKHISEKKMCQRACAVLRYPARYPKASSRWALGGLLCGRVYNET